MPDGLVACNLVFSITAMRLINTVTLQIEDFSSEAGLVYAILSHTWEEDEVSFQDMQRERARSKDGFQKIQNFCQRAKDRGFQYGWMDTCCIDKSSSAELSEAINSMFRWYKSSAECYVYLSDVTGTDVSARESLVSSNWFKRGWTLQELLASNNIFFFNRAWEIFGTKTELMSQICEATQIQRKALNGDAEIKNFSVAQRMSWAANRTTTRPEDRAYSLLGLFYVNMPLLYGEGEERAFLRLQEEIIKYSSDQTIFAWSGVDGDGRGLLAGSPDLFANCTSFSRPLAYWSATDAFSLTNIGLSIELSLTPWDSLLYACVLACKHNEKSKIIVFMRKLADAHFVRVQAEGYPDVLAVDDYEVGWASREVRKRRIFVQQYDYIPRSLSRLTHPNEKPLYGVKISSTGLLNIREYCSSTGHWDQETGIAEMRGGHYGPMVTIDLRGCGTRIKRMAIGLDFDFRPRCIVSSSESPIEGIWDGVLRRVDKTQILITQNVEHAQPMQPWELGGYAWCVTLAGQINYSVVYFERKRRRGTEEVTMGYIKIMPDRVGSRFVWAIAITLTEYPDLLKF